MRVARIHPGGTSELEKWRAAEPVRTEESCFSGSVVGRFRLLTRERVQTLAASTNAVLDEDDSADIDAPVFVIRTSAPEGVLSRHEDLRSYVFVSVEFASAEEADAPLVELRGRHNHPRRRELWWAGSVEHLQERCLAGATADQGLFWTARQCPRYPNMRFTSITKLTYCGSIGEADHALAPQSLSKRRARSRRPIDHGGTP